MQHKYAHILSPVKAGNYVLKNRLISSNAMPHFLQGPESFPAEPLMDHMAACAQNGAAIVTFADWTNPGQRESFNEDGRRFPMFDLDGDVSVENYISQLADRVHWYDSRISLAVMPFGASDVMSDVWAVPGHDQLMTDSRIVDPEDYYMSDMFRNGAAAREMTHEEIHDLVEYWAQRVLKYKNLGFDMCTIHCAYRATLFSRFISPRTNLRTDEYGGDVAGRARILLELCQRIKKLCGKGFPIEVQITGSEDGGTTIEDTIELAKLAEGLIDIFQFRAQTGNLNHPTGYNSRLHDFAALADCAAVKASGTKILCAPIGGFQDPDDMEQILASGQADMIAAARAFFVDTEWYKKIQEERGEDVVPCIRCNKCHVPSLNGPWVSFCSVNPLLGQHHVKDKLTAPVERVKNVAVAGGGPAGMAAAMYLAQRGHKVTLFEASDRLGGQLKLMDYPSFKWPLVTYREYLIRQVNKLGVTVRLNTPATTGNLQGFEAVILALGATPNTPPIPGAESCRNIFTVFGHEAEMGHRCVVVGGSESGTEAALYLAETGHDVTLLTRGDTLAPDATPIHYREMMVDYWKTLKGFHPVFHAETTKIGQGYVEYKDENGQTQVVECDDVVVLGGMRPHQQEAMELSGTAPEVWRIGDCRQVGNLHTCSRSAYAAAAQI
jgi:2,4-dienoyl-CoA reductase-like NADH-dependent reductase (Old Yellow Enzyme family)/thioredoxin reductase